MTDIIVSEDISLKNRNKQDFGQNFGEIYNQLLHRYEQYIFFMFYIIFINIFIIFICIMYMTVNFN